MNNTNAPFISTVSFRYKLLLELSRTNKKIKKKILIANSQFSFVVISGTVLLYHLSYDSTVVKFIRREHLRAVMFSNGQYCTISYFYEWNKYLTFTKNWWMRSFFRIQESIGYAERIVQYPLYWYEEVRYIIYISILYPV